MDTGERKGYRSKKGVTWCLTSLQTAETLTTTVLTCQLEPVTTYYLLRFCGVRTRVHILYVRAC